MIALHKHKISGIKQEHEQSELEQMLEKALDLLATGGTLQDFGRWYEKEIVPQNLADLNMPITDGD